MRMRIFSVCTRFVQILFQYFRFMDIYLTECEPGFVGTAQRFIIVNLECSSSPHSSLALAVFSPPQLYDNEPDLMAASVRS